MSFNVAAPGQMNPAKIAIPYIRGSSLRLPFWDELSLLQCKCSRRNVLISLHFMLLDLSGSRASTANAFGSPPAPFFPPPPPRWPLRNCVKQSRGALIAKADVAAHTVLRCACALDTLAYSIFKATSNAQSEIEEGCNARTASGANLKLEVWLISNHCPALPRRRQCCRATVINPSHTCVLHLCLCTV